MGKYDNLLLEMQDWFSAKYSGNVKLVDYNAEFEGGGKDVLGVFNTLGGTNDGNNVEVIPYFINFYVDQSNEEFIPLLNDFSKEFNNTNKVYDLDNYKIYTTMPVQQSVFTDNDTTFWNTFIVSGTLVIYRNILELKYLNVGLDRINFIDLNLTYATSPSSMKLSGETLNKNKVQMSTLTLSFTCYHALGQLSNTMRLLRTGQVSGNNPIDVVLEFSDGVKERYKTYIDSFTVIFDKQNPSMTSVVMGLYYE